MLLILIKGITLMEGNQCLSEVDGKKLIDEGVLGFFLPSSFYWFVSLTVLPTSNISHVYHVTHHTRSTSVNNAAQKSSTLTYARLSITN